MTTRTNNNNNNNNKKKTNLKPNLSENTLNYLSRENRTSFTEISLAIKQKQESIKSGGVNSTNDDCSNSRQIHSRKENLPFIQNPNRRASDTRHMSNKRSKENLLLNNSSSNCLNKESRMNSSQLLSPIQQTHNNSLAPVHYHPARRESFLYKSDNDHDNIKLQMRSASIVSEQ